MSRVRLIGRDWTAPTYRSPWQQDRATRFEPTTLGKLRQLYAAPRSESLSHSIAAAALMPVAVIALVIIWSIA